MWGWFRWVSFCTQCKVFALNPMQSVHLSNCSILGLTRCNTPKMWLSMYLRKYRLILPILLFNTFNLLGRWIILIHKLSTSGQSLSSMNIHHIHDHQLEHHKCNIVFIIPIIIPLEMSWCTSEHRDLRICIPSALLFVSNFCYLYQHSYALVKCRISIPCMS